MHGGVPPLVTEETRHRLGRAAGRTAWIDNRRGTARPDRRGSRGRRGPAPEEGAPRPARRPDPARVRRVGQPLPRLRLAGGHRSVHLLRHLARLLGGLRADPATSGSSWSRSSSTSSSRRRPGRCSWVGSFRPEGSGSGASWLRSEPSSSSRCGGHPLVRRVPRWSSCSRASRARCSSPTRTSRSGSPARCWR